MNWDLSKYLALFVSESRDHLDALSAGLVRLEKSGGAGEDPAGNEANKKAREEAWKRWRDLLKKI